MRRDGPPKQLRRDQAPGVGVGVGVGVGLAFGADEGAVDAQGDGLGSVFAWPWFCFATQETYWPWFL